MRIDKETWECEQSDAERSFRLGGCPFLYLLLYLNFRGGFHPENTDLGR